MARGAALKGGEDPAGREARPRPGDSRGSLDPRPGVPEDREDGVLGRRSRLSRRDFELQMEASDALEQSGAARTEPSDPMLALITCEPPDKMAVINVLIVLQSLLSSSVDAAASFNSLGENDTALKHRTQIMRLAVRLAVACNHGSTQLEQLIVRRLEDERWPETFDDFGDSRGTSVYVMVRELRKMLIQELQKDESGLLRVSDAVNDRVTAAITASSAFSGASIQQLSARSAWEQLFQPALVAALALKKAAAKVPIDAAASIPNLMSCLCTRGR